MRKPVCAALLSLAVLLPSAHGAMIRLTAAGNITSSNMTGYGVGTNLSATFVFDSDASPTVQQGQYALVSNPFTSLDLTIGGYHSSYSGQFGQISMYNGVSLQDGITFYFANHPAYYQGTYPAAGTMTLDPIFSQIQQTVVDLRINLGSASNSIIPGSGFPIPTSYNLSDFTVNQSILVGFSAGSLMAGMGTLTAEDASATPEPAAWILLASGFAALWAFKSASSSTTLAGTATATRASSPFPPPESR